jgi:hypothetical protein
VLVIASLLAPACGPKPPANGGSSGGGTPSDPLAALVWSTKVANLGKVEIKDPDPKALVALPGIGSAPPNQLWVYLKDGLGRADGEAVAVSLGGRVVGEIALLNAYQVETTTADAAGLLAQIRQASSLPQVQFALPNLLLDTQLATATSTMANPTTNSSYAGTASRPYEMIGLREAWAMVRAAGITLSEVKVGVLDRPVWGASFEVNQTGGSRLVGLERSDLEAAPADGNLFDINHGTQVVHVIAANHHVGRSIGVASVLGAKLTVIARNVFDTAPDFAPTTATPGAGGGITAAEIDGASYVVKDFARMIEQIEAGAGIINCSYGPRPPAADATAAALQTARDVHSAYRRFLERLNSAHPQVLVVASAGNNALAINETNRYFGQALGNLITVAALTQSGLGASFSNFMPSSGNLEIALAAPGVDILTGVGADGRPNIASGTSFATPMVAAAAAIVRSIKPDLTAAQIKQILVQTAADRVPSADGKTSQAVPANVSGRILRVDNAVLLAVNLVRQAKGQEPLTREQLLGLHDMTITATGGPATYTVTAKVDNVAARDELTLSVSSGTATINGNAKAQLPSSGELTWQIQKPATYKGELEIKVTRQPVGAEARLVIPDNAALGKLQQTTKLYLTLDGEEATTGWKQLSFAVDKATPNTRMTIEKYQSGINWDGASFEATSYLKYTSGQAYTISLKGQISSDGAVVQWFDASYKYEWGTNTELVLEARFEGVPLTEGNNRYWTNGADASKYLSRFRSVVYSGPDNKRVAKEYTEPKLTNVNLDFRRY